MKAAVVLVVLFAITAARERWHPSSFMTVGGFVASGAQTTARTIWDRVYTEEQAKRGEAVYFQECASCHGSNLAGGDLAPALIVENFAEHWSGQTLGDLVNRIRTTMPQDSPGRLSLQQYCDVVALMLKANQFPSGEKELEPNVGALSAIRIDKRPAPRPQ